MSRQIPAAVRLAFRSFLPTNVDSFELCQVRKRFSSERGAVNENIPRFAVSAVANVVLSSE